MTGKRCGTAFSLTILWLAWLCPAWLGARPLAAQVQQVNGGQQLVFAGLRSTSAQGQFNAVQTDASGNLYLLLDQKDGVRILKTDNAASTVLAQALLGAAGDVGIALALDSSGNVYVTGTTTSGSLIATSGAAIPSRTDTSTNSFVAKFNAALVPQFVTLTGGSRIASSALAVTADAVFVTGSLFASNLPVTADGIQQAPAPGSTQNGFVERFSTDGSTLVYATYLTGAQGNTIPAAIAADSSDNAYVVGSTTSTGYPTVAALVPAVLTSPSGFLTKLTPAGDSILFSTFVSGPGLTSIALDAAAQNLLVSGSIAPGQFPLETVTSPIAPLNYQSVVKLPLDGSSVSASTMLAPGTQSFLAPVAGGGEWVDQNLTAPLLPASSLASLGTGLASRISSQNSVNQVARFGGLPSANSTYASLPIALTSVAVDPAGEALIAGSIAPTASSSLLASETYDLPLTSPPPGALPATLRSSETTSASCTGSLCAGSAAYLAKLNPSGTAPSLVFSSDDAPFLVLRNLGSAEALNLQIASSGASVTSNCPSALPSGAECDLLLAGATAASVTVTASNAAAQSLSVANLVAPSSTIVFFPKELDFGLQTSTSAPGQRVITVTNLGSTPQTFTSAALIAPKLPTPFSELSSDCPASGATTTKLLTAGATCHITLGLAASADASRDGSLQQSWQIGARTVLLTGYSQAATLSVSSFQVDFGTQYKAGLHLPRFLHLSNASSSAVAHAVVTLPASSAFALVDGCPSVLAAHSVCTMRLDYLPANYPSRDSVTLALDQGLTVLVTGQSLPQPGVGGSVVNPNLQVTPSSLTFANAVPVTGIGATQTVIVTNTGASSFTLSAALTGDFSQQTSCAASLPGGQSCSIAVTFVPSQPGVRQGLLAITAGSGFSPAYVALSGTATNILPANNGILDFGSSPVGQPVTKFYKIAQPISSLTALASAPYSVSIVQDLGYAPGQPASTAYGGSATAACSSCFLAVRFLPTAAGAQPGSLTLSSASGGMPYALTLTGTGLPTTGLLLTPLTPSFGTVPVESTGAPVLFTLTNLSASMGTITVSGSATVGDFMLSPGSPPDPVCGGTLAYSASCLLSAVFSPTATGSRSGSLTVQTSDGNVTATLNGFATVDPGLALSPTALTYNNTAGTQATRQSITLTNTGALPLTIGTPTNTSASFTFTSTCTTLAPAASCGIQVSFLPAASLVSDILTIPVTSTSTGGASTTTPYTVPLTGAYANSSAGLEITPAQAIFGPQTIGQQSLPRQFSISNLTAKSLSVQVFIPRQFALLGVPCTALAPGASCSLSTAFLPLTNAEITGSLLVQATPTDGSTPLTSIAYLDGYGVSPAGPLSITSSTFSSVLNFGQVTSGQTSTQSVTLSNGNASGSPAITVYRISSAPPFLSTSNCGLALTAGQSCSVTLTYRPTNQVANGTASPPNLSDVGVLTIESDAASSPDLLDLAGQAGPAPVSAPSNVIPLAAYTVSQGSLTFPSTMVGNVSSSQTVMLTNSGSASLHILSVFTSPDFAVQTTCATLLAGASCTLTVASTPQTPGTHVAALQIASDSTTSLEFITLLAPATPAALTFSPASLSFGDLVVGASSAPLPVQVTNSGNSPVIFASTSAVGDYTVAGDCPMSGASLAPGQSCSAQVTFSPTQPGTRPGNLAFATSGATNPLSVSLSGVGIQSQLLASPTPLAFGVVDLGSNARLSLTLANNGTATVSNLNLVPSGDYSVSRPCTFSVLTPGQTCTVEITFTPTALGARNGVLIITSTDPNSPLNVPLSGSGLGGGSFILTVNGGASASQSVTPPTPANFSVLLTPTGGLTGQVAFTCTALNTAQYLSCSLQPSSVVLGATPQTVIATVNTVSAVPLTRPAPSLRSETLAAILLPCLLCVCKRKRLRFRLLVATLTLSGLLATEACSSNSIPNLRLANSGTYQFRVTATSTSGTILSQSVTLNVTLP